MSTRDLFDKRRQALENEYFRDKDRELIERLRELAQQDEARQALRSALEGADEALVAGLHAEGFTRDTLAVLHLVPLVEVAWADDWVDEGERELILSLAVTRGVEPDTPSYSQLVQWLEHKPEPLFFERVDTLLAATLALQPPAARRAATQDVLDWSTKIAEATGGILHMHPISRAERECIAHIADRLTRDPPATPS